MKAMINSRMSVRGRCIYCGLNRENRELKHGMSDEMIEAAAEAVDAECHDGVDGAKTTALRRKTYVEIIKDIKKLEDTELVDVRRSPSVSEVAPPPDIIVCGISAVCQMAPAQAAAEQLTRSAIRTHRLSR